MMANNNSNTNIGWNFPPTGGGVQDGLNNPGAAHFKGNRLHHLAREILQNSLDARFDLKTKVHVTFELKVFDREQVPGVDELLKHIDACIDECRKQEDSAGEEELKHAKSIFNEERITFLKVYDSQTTGLTNKNWNALVKGSGTSIKSDETAGGSHGIGKYAAFTISPARTVYYWTSYMVNGASETFVEKFQGKSMLMHHTFEGSDRQSIGFWGEIDECKELSTIDVPAEFRIIDRNQQPVQGTAIWIAGFNGESGWQDQIAKLVIENYFYAIENDLLEVILEPDSDNDNPIEINSSTLDKWLEHLESSGDAESKDIANYTRIYLGFLRDKPCAAQKDDEDFGICKFWIELGENLPRHVALVRNTGMLITTSQKNTSNFRSVYDFIALCYFESPEGNQLLRKMENPQHDQFLPDYLAEDQRERGKRALKRITDWIRKSVRDQAVRRKEKTTKQLNELSRYLPLHLSEGPLDTDEEGDKSFGEYGKISIKRKTTLNTFPSPIVTTGDNSGQSDEDIITNGSNSSNPKNGGKGGTPNNNGDEEIWKNVHIADVRVLPDQTNSGLYHVSFVPMQTAQVNLKFRIAGDQGSKVRDSIQAASISNDGELTLSKLSTYSVQKDTRFSLNIFDSSCRSSFAWIVTAFEKKEK